MSSPSQVSAPTIRTLLLTDLCDSVALVERLGDRAAAELFRSHDLQVLQLQERWLGRLIDRSDGLLLLFERPLNAIGFAVDYQQVIARLGAAHGAELKARAGLHVGEVLLWQNTREAVTAGAKPLEVEGLAKLLAARLMGLARPGQILLSAVAESLARRSVRDDDSGLGERLVWRCHGRWRLKGVPTTQEIWEVGLVGHAPLRMPLGGGKAWRDLPLWRRPPALALQAVAVLGLALGAWMATRSEPALAFAERDWVVVADVSNQTGDPDLARPVQHAVRIALEQSRYINLLGEDHLADALQRLGNDNVQGIDRDRAVDIAVREGARAVVLPVVSQRGGRWEVSLELIDPSTGQTLSRSRRSATGFSDNLIQAVDEAARDLRQTLGESMAAIARSEPLPQVTTRSLPALRAYSLAEVATGKRDYATARQLYTAALEADPDFALAHVGQARLLWRMLDAPGARTHLAEALTRRDALPLRERLYLDAWSAELSPRGWATEQWEALARLYPDFVAGPSNASWGLLQDNRFAQAEPFARSAGMSRHPMRVYPLVHLARAQLAQGQLEQVQATLREVDALSGRRHDLWGDVLVLSGQPGKAREILRAAATGQEASDRMMGLRGLMMLEASEGNCSQMQAYAGQMVDFSREMSDIHRLHFDVVALAARLCDAEDPLPEAPLRELGQRVEQAIAQAHAQGDAGVNDLYLRLLALSLVAQNGQQSDLAAGWLGRHQQRMAELGNPLVIKLLSVVQARQLIDIGQVQKAADRLAAQLDGTELYQTRVVLRDAYRLLDRQEDRVRQEEWLVRNAGRAWAEVIASQALQPLNIYALRPLQQGTAPAR